MIIFCTDVSIEVKYNKCSTANFKSGCGVTKFVTFFHFIKILEILKIEVNFKFLGVSFLGGDLDPLYVLNKYFS